MHNIEKLFGYQFKDAQLLQSALTHTSKGGKQFERLEFLGDRVLNLSITLLLMKKFPSASEGKLAKTLAEIICTPVLREVALKWQVEQFLHCTKAQTQSILPDACEAILGAMFLDSGMNLTLLRTIIEKHWLEYLDNHAFRDVKTLLQEIAYKIDNNTPLYTSTRISGKDHNPVFEAKVSVSKLHAIGRGSSRKAAEKAAATLLLEKMNV